MGGQALLSRAACAAPASHGGHARGGRRLRGHLPGGAARGAIPAALRCGASARERRARTHVCVQTTEGKAKGGGERHRMAQRRPEPWSWPGGVRWSGRGRAHGGCGARRTPRGAPVAFGLLRCCICWHADAHTPPACAACPMRLARVRSMCAASTVHPTWRQIMLRLRWRCRLSRCVAPWAGKLSCVPWRPVLPRLSNQPESSLRALAGAGGRCSDCAPPTLR